MIFMTLLDCFLKPIGTSLPQQNAPFPLVGKGWGGGGPGFLYKMDARLQLGAITGEIWKVRQVGEEIVYEICAGVKKMGFLGN
jgi:hypothetical protein